MEGTDGVKTTGADAVLQDIREKATTAVMQDTEPDEELFKILNDHIVTPASGTSAVDQAVADILALAKKRAES